MAMSPAHALGPAEAENSTRILDRRNPWFELWGIHAVGFLLTVSLAVFLPTGPSRLDVSLTTYVLIYSVLGLFAVAFGILGGLALFRSLRQPGSSKAW